MHDMLQLSTHIVVRDENKLQQISHVRVCIDLVAHCAHLHIWEQVQMRPGQSRQCRFVFESWG